MERVEPVATIPVVRDDGEAAPADAGIEAAYSRPYLAHASIGPSCALAEWSGDGASRVVADPGRLSVADQLARAAREAEMVDVVHAMGAGCYGHNGADDVALDAALLARAARPGALPLDPRRRALMVALRRAMRIRLSAAWTRRARSWTGRTTCGARRTSRRPGFGSGVNLLAAQLLRSARRPRRASFQARPAPETGTRFRSTGRPPQRRPSSLAAGAAARSALRSLAPRQRLRHRELPR